MRQFTRVLYFLILSAIAAALLLMVGYVGSNEPESVGWQDRTTAGAVFIVCSILCVSMTLRPSWLHLRTRHKGNQLRGREAGTGSRHFVGHHPDCDCFRSHRIALNGVQYCSGCFGLMLGSIAAICLMAIYVLLARGSLSNVSSALVLFGLCALLATFAVSLVRPRKPLLTAIANAMMVPGLSMVTVGILEMTGSLLAALLVILFSFLWADTRIQISQWMHQNTCRECQNECKMY